MTVLLSDVEVLSRSSARRCRCGREARDRQGGGGGFRGAADAARRRLTSEAGERAWRLSLAAERLTLDIHRHSCEPW